MFYGKERWQSGRMRWAIPEYSFIGFIKSLASQSIHLYKSIYKALFVDPSV